jgi:poly-beta-1,6-N-acetyl-D-glucosamine synthase
MEGWSRAVRSTRAPRVVALVPAHNEQAQIRRTLEALLAQSRRPDRIVVVADNCTDATVDVVRELDVEVLETVGNKGRKAGALNQGWSHVARSLGADDFLLVLDADTHLSSRFVETALERFRADPSLAAVCGAFSGRPEEGRWPTRLIALLQRMEYERYRRQVARRRGASRVLSGTSTIFRADVIARIAAERGFVYDETSIVEDFELTLALRQRELCYRQPRECRVTTEVMPTIGKLWHQRVRWFRGTLDELRRYGLSRTTAHDYVGQLLLVGAVAIRLLFVAALALSLAAAGSLSFDPRWTLLIAIVAIERAVSVRQLGLSAAVVASTLVIELLYSVFAECYFVRSLWLHLRGRAAVWHAT